ncbi:MAG: [FeFe] hydrogenase H-cluster radical SAM maturase HydG [Candidatus Omnitrophota bacterium]
MEVTGILDNARKLNGLSKDEIAQLLSVDDGLTLSEILKAADEVKEQVFGKRISIFAPIYLTNECINNCLYCGFRVDNRLLKRRTLSLDEILKEAGVLSEQGHKRVLLVSAENPREASAELVAEIVDAIYERTILKTISVNMAPLSCEDFKILSNSKIWAYQSFQETYSESQYKKLHPKGKKADFNWRISTMDRALFSGIKHIGMGFLFGLYDYRFEVLALVDHINSLKEKFGVYPYNISIPRLRPALGAVLTEAPYPVSDSEFKKITAILRLALPSVEIALSTRETKELRNEMVKIGVTQMSAGSRTSPGGYTAPEFEYDKSQFAIEDIRTIDEVIRDLNNLGLIPEVDYEAVK